jgi:hypothetical protein
MSNGFGCYLLYLAVKSHFSNEKYDYFKYNGRVKADHNSFAKRTDRYFFEKLAKKISNPDELERFFVANIIQNQHVWIGEIQDDTLFDVFMDWKKRLESITYTFNQDVQTIVEASDKFIDAFKINVGQHPLLMKLYKQQKISLETITILDMALNCGSYWDKNIVDRIVWPEFYRRINKYKSFLLKYIGQPKIAEFRKKIKEEFFVD